MPGNVAARSIFALAGSAIPNLPTGSVVANIEDSSLALGVLSEHFEVVGIRGSSSARRVELQWAPASKDKKWLSSDDMVRRMGQINHRAAMVVADFYEQRRRRSRGSRSLMMPTFRLQFKGLDNYAAVKAMDGIYFQSEVPVIKYIREIVKANDFESYAKAYIYLNSAVSIFSYRNFVSSELRQSLDKIFRNLAARSLQDFVPDWNEFGKLVEESTLVLFDPFAWSQRNSAYEDLEFEF